MRPVRVLSAALLCSALSAPALGAACNPPGGFNAFLAEFKKDAAAQGVSQKGLSALNGMTLDESVLAADKRQGVFKQTFEEFSGRMISRDRMTKGLRQMQALAPVLKKIEAEFGVPGAVIVAIWGLETDFGVNLGKKDVIRSVATLAFDCRRTDMFQAQLTDALRIVDRGDLRAGRDARRLGRRFRPDAVPAVVLLQVRRRLRRRRPARSRRTACRTCSPRPPTISRATAGSAASAGTRAIPTSRRSAAGTRRWSTPRPSRRSPNGSKAARRAPKSRGARSPNFCAVIAGLQARRFHFCLADSDGAARRRDPAACGRANTGFQKPALQPATAQ